MSEENVGVVRRFCERDDRTSLDSLMAILHGGHDDVRAWSPKSADVWLSRELAERESGRSPDPTPEWDVQERRAEAKPKPMRGATDRHTDLLQISYRSRTRPQQMLWTRSGPSHRTRETVPSLPH
jgi:hypothetical protein